MAPVVCAGGVIGLVSMIFSGGVATMNGRRLRSEVVVLDARAQPAGGKPPRKAAEPVKRQSKVRMRRDISASLEEEEAMRRSSVGGSAGA
mmetsp:Transcript_28766/g.58939  ORF Transcript_28766/g.58939 Transcript_28766/m.58939 type:complete len:90 (-) Transcript_28766:33-302(-)